MFAVQEEMREREEREVKGESKQTRQDANKKSRLQAEVAGRRRAAGDHVIESLTWPQVVAFQVVPLLLSHSPLPLSVAWKPGTSSICHSSPLTFTERQETLTTTTSLHSCGHVTGTAVYTSDYYPH